MISNKLELMRHNFINNFSTLTQDDQRRGIPSCIVKEWIDKEIEVVDVFMPLLGWKKLTVGGSTYWFDPRFYDDFLLNVTEHLYTAETD